MEQYYNLHGFVKFTIQYDDKWYFKNILEHYDGYRSEEGAEPDFIVKLQTGFRDRKHRNRQRGTGDENFFCTDGRFVLGPDSFECIADRYKIARWSFRLTNLSGIIVAEIWANQAGFLYMAGLVIDFLIEVFSCLKHAPMLHAACVAKDNEGLLIAARGGGGKTSLALHLVEQYGFKLLSDNFTIVRQGDGWGYQTPLNVFGYNLSREIKDSFTRTQQFEFLAKRMLHFLTGGYFKLFTRVRPEVVYGGKTTDHCRIKNLALLIPYTGKELEMEETCLPDILDRLVINQMLDFQYYHDYALEYNFFFATPFFRHWERYPLELQENLAALKVYKVLLPIGKPRPYAEALLRKLEML